MRYRAAMDCDRSGPKAFLNEEVLLRTVEKLRIETDEAIAAALHDEHHFDGAINWGDLSCTSVVFVTNGIEHGWRVTIEEASPKAHELRNFIMKWLLDRGWRDVNVLTEW